METFHNYIDMDEKLMIGAFIIPRGDGERQGLARMLQKRGSETKRRLDNESSDMSQVTKT